LKSGTESIGFDVEAEFCVGVLEGCEREGLLEFIELTEEFKSCDGISGEGEEELFMLAVTGDEFRPCVGVTEG